MHSVTCVVRDFNAVADTCTVEIQGIGIVDAWLDGTAIAPTVDRSYIVSGALGVVTLADINRPCDATLIQITPPGNPVSYNPDPIVTYTGSLYIPTDSTGAGCATITFPQPYSAVPTINASAGHPASVTISTVTTTGFTACVTGGKVSSHHHVAYTARSNKTSTATKNKAPTVQHNETDVATHYTIDFKDGDITWDVEDKASPDRAQIMGTLSDAYKATLGLGGSSGAIVFTTYNLSGSIAANCTTDPGDRLLWGSNVDVDQGGFVTAGTNGTTGQIVIPSDGWYAMACETHFSTGTLAQGWRYNIVLGVAWQDATAGTADNRDAYIYFDQSKATSSPAEVYGCLPPVIKYLHKGTTVQFFCQDQAGAGLGYNVGYISVWKLGAASSAAYSTTVTIANQYTPTGGTGIGNATTWDTILSDNTSGAIWKTAHPTRLTAPAAGIYLITANYEIASPNATAGGGVLTLELYKNGNGGTPIYESNLIAPPFPSLNRQSLTFTVPLTLAAGEYLELAFGTNDNASLVSVMPGGTSFSLTYIGTTDSSGTLGAGVTNIDGIAGSVGLLAGSGISVTASGQNITIAATGGGSGSVPAGGTTGQVLTKNSGTDYDVGWASDTDTSSVTSLNTKTGDLTLSPGTGIAIATVGSTITISNTGASYTLPDATTSAIGGVEIDQAPASGHPIAITLAGYLASLTNLTHGNLAAAAGILLSQLGQSGAASGQVPQWNGSAWVPATVSGGSSGGYGFLATGDTVPTPISIGDGQPLMAQIA